MTQAWKLVWSSINQDVHFISSFCKLCVFVMENMELFVRTYVPPKLLWFLNDCIKWFHHCVPQCPNPDLQLFKEDRSSVIPASPGISPTTTFKLVSVLWLPSRSTRNHERTTPWPTDQRGYIVVISVSGPIYGSFDLIPQPLKGVNSCTSPGKVFKWAWRCGQGLPQGKMVIANLLNIILKRYADDATWLSGDDSKPGNHFM